LSGTEGFGPPDRTGGVGAIWGEVWGWVLGAVGAEAAADEEDYETE